MSSLNNTWLRNLRSMHHLPTDVVAYFSSRPFFLLLWTHEVQCIPENPVNSG